MYRYHCEAGARDPNFPYKVPIDGETSKINKMIEWCDEYPGGEFERYYIRWKRYTEGFVYFTFETERPALMFALKWGSE